MGSPVVLVRILWRLFASKSQIYLRILQFKRGIAIFTGFSQGHSFIGSVIALTRIFPVAYSLILSNVTAISFLQSNMM